MTNAGTSNILWLVDHLGYSGSIHGAGMYYLNTIPRLQKAGLCVKLCVLRPRDDLTGQFEMRNISVRHLGRRKMDPRTFFDVVKIIKEEDVHLIHAHGYGSSNFARLAAVICKIPSIVHAHDEDFNYPWYQGIADILLSRYTCGAIAVSEAVKEACVAKRKIRSHSLWVLNNGIHLEAFTHADEARAEKEKQRLKIGPDWKVVGMVGRLRSEKGARYLLEAAVLVLKAVPEAVFLIAGDGPSKLELEELARRLGIAERTIFAGFCQDVAAVLSVFDVSVIPSLHEGWGMALLEAMAMGKPIVATFVGGMKEILKDGETGFFVPPQDPQALAARIIDLLRSERERRRLGKNAERECRKYSIDSHAAAVKKIYLTMLSGS